MAEGIGADVLLKDGVNIDRVIEKDEKAICNVFDSFMPDIVFVVSQFSHSIEKLAIQEAKRRGVYCIAGVEHWSFYKERFSKTDNYGNVVGNGFEYLPNKVLLNDDIAYQDAIDVGMPAKCLSIVGNPVLESRWKHHNISEYGKQTLDNFHALPVNKKIILFISEPYSECLSDNSQQYPGFDEIDVIKDILWAMPEDACLCIKPHPADSVEKFLPFISHENSCRLVSDEPIDDILLGVDNIVGMGSILLLEIALMRQSVISYRPNEQVSFVGNRLGFTKKIMNREDLQQALKKNSPMRENQLSNQYVGSTTKIINSIVSVALTQ